MEAKTKILHVNNTMNIGGIELFLMNLIKNTDMSRYEIALLTYSDKAYDLEAELKNMNIQIFRIDNPAKISPLKHMRQIYKVLSDYKPTAVISHTYFNSAYVVLMGLIVKTQIRAVHSHTAMASEEKRLHKIIKWILPRIIINRFATHKFACSREAGVALYGDESSTIIPNGITLKDFRYSKSKRNMARNLLGIEEDNIVVGHIGRFAYPKNHSFLISVFINLLSINPKSKLILIGDGPDKTKIETLIEEKGIGNSVLFLGNRHDISFLLNSMDVFVFPSIYEGMPVSLIEAQANNINILVSDTVSKDVKLSEKLEFFSLDAEPLAWAKKILDFESARGITRTNKLLDNYDISNTVKIFDEIIIKSNEKSRLK